VSDPVNRSSGILGDRWLARPLLYSRPSKAVAGGGREEVMKSMKAGGRVVLALGTLALLTLTACSTAAPTGTPGVERLGNTILRYTGPEVDAILSYRFASVNLGEDPTGDVIPLATQREFGEAYPQLASALARAAIAGEPLDYYPSRTPKGLDFLVAPGTGLALQSVWVNDLDVAIGRLYFFLPSGVQPGHYELRIDLQEAKVRIPFQLGGEG
jgi:hypothetical protein